MLQQDIQDSIYIDDISYDRIRYNYHISIIINKSIIFINGNIEEVCKQLYNLCTSEYIFKDGNHSIYQTKEIYIDTFGLYGKYIKSDLESIYKLNINSFKNNTQKYKTILQEGTYKNINSSIYSFEQKKINDKEIDDWFREDIENFIIKNKLKKYKK